MPLSPTTRTIVRDLLPHADGVLQVGHERAEVAIVDADQRGPDIEHPLQILRFVELDQCGHTQFADRRRAAGATGPVSRHSAISSTASAPATRASSTW